MLYTVMIDRRVSGVKWIYRYAVGTGPFVTTDLDIWTLTAQLENDHPNAMIDYAWTHTTENGS